MSSSKKTGIRGALILSACAGFTLVTTHQQAKAAGFYLQEHSASNMGDAYAGSTTNAEDASTVYYNPAGMTALGRGQITVDGTGIFARTNLTDRGSTLGGGPVGGVDSDNPIIDSLVPSAYLAYPVYQDKVWAGFGFTTPFGLSYDYADNWYGRYDSIKSNLRTYDFQPSVAFKVNQYLSLGAGVDYQRATAELSQALFAGAFGAATVNGSDDAWGYTAGATVTPMTGTKIGFDYRSAIKHDLQGRLVVAGTGLADTNTGAHAELNLPDIATLGVSQDLTKQWTVMGQATYYGWSRFKSLTVITDSGVTAENTAENYRDTLGFSLGAEYKWNPQWTLRAGYQFDPTPTRSPFRDTRVPDSNRNWLTVGGTYNITPAIALDLSGAYIMMADTSVNVTRNIPAVPAVVDAGVSGGSITLVAAGLTFKF